jgi:opacity protein-like surface antigen
VALTSGSEITTFCTTVMTSQVMLLNPVWFLGLMLCFAPNVFAQTHSSTSSPADSGGWFVAAYVGGAHTQDSDLTILQPTLGNSLSFENVRFSSRSSKAPLYYGIRGGYFLDRIPFLGFDAEFIHLKVFANPQQRVRVSGVRRNVGISAELPLGEIAQQYSVSHGVNLLLFDVAARHRIKRAADGRLLLIVRAGLGPTLPHTESRIEGQGQEQYEIGRLVWQASAGAEFKLGRRLFVLGEYKFTRTRQHGKVSLGTAESLLRTHHGVFGVGYYF